MIFLKALKLAPPWLWVGSAALAMTAVTAAGAIIYQRAVTSTLASVKEQIFERVVWQKETNLKMDGVTIRKDGEFGAKLEEIEKKWR